MKTRIFLFPFRGRSLPILSTVLMAALLAGCAQLFPTERAPEPEPVVAEKKPPPKPVEPPPPSTLYEWYGTDDYISHIEIDVNDQKARFYRGAKEVGWTRVASGVYKYPTPIGTFAVMEKVQDKRSNLYGRIYNKNGKLVKRNAKMGVDTVPAGGHFKGASMPYFLRLTNDGIGMPAGPIPRPGRRASHGCIRMPRKFAPILYRYVDLGTQVTIKGKGPTYASYLAKQRRSRPKVTPVAAVEPTAPTTGTTPEPAQPAAGQSEMASETAASTTQPTSVGESSSIPETESASTTEEMPGSTPDEPSSSSGAPTAVDAPSSSPPASATETTPVSTPSDSGVAPASAPSALPEATPTPTPRIEEAEREATSTSDTSSAQPTMPVETPPPPPSSPE